MTSLKTTIAGATEGPWVISRHNDKFHKSPLLRVRQKGSPMHVCGIHKNINMEANAKFIATARTALPQLLDLAEKMAEALETIRDNIKDNVSEVIAHLALAAYDDFVKE